MPIQGFSARHAFVNMTRDWRLPAERDLFTIHQHTRLVDVGAKQVGGEQSGVHEVRKRKRRRRKRKNHKVHSRTSRAQVTHWPARFDGNSMSTYATCFLHWSMLAGRHAWETRVNKAKRRRRARNGYQNTSFAKYAQPTHQTETRFWPKALVMMPYRFGRPLGRQEYICLHRGRRSEHGGGGVKKWRVPF